MKLDRFINRPVLSTVISILIVILGAIGLATLPITQYPDIAPPTVSVIFAQADKNRKGVRGNVVLTFTVTAAYGCQYGCLHMPEKALRFVSQNPIWRIIPVSICLLLKEKIG